MEKVCQRFALITKKILNNVDNESLINFKQAGRNNVAFLEKERFYWIRIIQRYNCLIGEFQEVWKKVVSKTPIEIIKELAVAVHQFSPILSKELHNETECSCNETREIRLSSLDFVKTVEKQWHPLFIAATSGSVYLCNHIIQKACDVKDPKLLNPKSMFAKITPIVFAAELNMSLDLMGDVSVFEFLHEKAEDKNPILSTDANWTLLHNLAANGDVQMCESMVTNVKDLSPRDIHGRTPCHMAALNGHEEVCYILMMHLTAINPKDNSGQTPLHLAASYGHFKVCRLLIRTAKACMDEDDMDDFLRIPLHVAALNGHVEVVRLFMANLGENEEKKTPVLSFKIEDLLLFNSTIPVIFLQWKKVHQTLLLNAIQGGSLNVIELLVEEYKLDVNRSDDFGMTPLHLASKLGKLEVCKFLSKYVLDKNTLDNDGQTPYDLAVSENKLDTASFLFCFSLFRMEDIQESVQQGVTKVIGPDANLGNTKQTGPGSQTG